MIPSVSITHKCLIEMNRHNVVFIGVISRKDLLDSKENHIYLITTGYLLKRYSFQKVIILMYQLHSRRGFAPKLRTSLVQGNQLCTR